jgi:hypothetical protein
MESAAGGEPCGEPAISLHSHHVSLVQWTTRLLPVIFVCVTFQPIDFCSVPNLPHFRQSVHSFALQWLPIFILRGTSAQQTFGLCQLFLILQT